jgi:zinc transporter ZupT
MEYPLEYAFGIIVPGILSGFTVGYLLRDLRKKPHGCFTLPACVVFAATLGAAAGYYFVDALLDVSQNSSALENILKI